MMTFEAIRAILEKRQTPKRFCHTMGVVETAERLASLYVPTLLEKARYGSLLHDCAKTADATEEWMAELAAQSRIAPPVGEKGKSLLHAAASETLARRDFGVEDEEILGAVRWHTTGHWGMTPLEMIVYCADMIEPNRHYPEVDFLRGYADQGLKTLTKICIEKTVEFLEQKGTAIDEHTFGLLRYMNEIEGEIPWNKEQRK